MAHLSGVDELESMCDGIQEDVGVSRGQVSLVLRHVGVYQVQDDSSDLRGQGSWVSGLL